MGSTLCGGVYLACVFGAAGACLVWWHIRAAAREKGVEAPVGPPADELRPMERVEKPPEIRRLRPMVGPLIDSRRHPLVQEKLALIAAGNWQPEGLGWADETGERGRE